MNMPHCEGVPSDRAQSIWQTADELFAGLERQKFPQVDEVRRATNIGMHDVQKVMKAWRSAQASRVTAEVRELPDDLREAATEFAAKCWRMAQGTASDALIAAQRAWEGERIEGDQIRAQLAEAFDKQSEAVEKLKVEVLASNAARDEALKIEVGLRSRCDKAEGQLTAIKDQMSDMTNELQDARTEQGLVSELRNQLKASEENNQRLQRELIQLAKRG